MNDVCDKCGKPIPPEAGRCIFCRPGAEEQPPQERTPKGSCLTATVVSSEYVVNCSLHGRVKIKAKVLADSVKCPFCWGKNDGKSREK
jgi:hypothetical protein